MRELPLDWLVRAADPRWVEILDASEERHFLARVRLARPDGEERVFNLRIVASSGDACPRVWEDGAPTLPIGCPARHFYADDSFCMGLPPDGPPVPLSRETADRWWAVLHGYLWMQIVADLTGIWPEGYEWAHGSTALLGQATEEIATTLLPAGVLDKVRRGSIRIDPRHRRLKGRRRPCPCGSGKPLARCHGPVVQMMFEGEELRAKGERQFWETYSGRACCGTMRRCPLRDQQETGR